MNKIILASGSPRRKEIFEIFETPFEIKVADIEEKIHVGETPEQIAMALAFEKAMAVVENCDQGDIIIAADTIVVKNEVLGKPKNDKDALRMLKLLENDVHFVISGLAVVQAHTFNKFVSFDKTKVKVKQLTNRAMKRYIYTGEVWGKAGAYGIQGKGSAMIEWIEGNYFNVVGLPISKLQSILQDHFQIELI
ncbi:nucleoside triphosphate pyrophosphatase [Marinisporobacter balticus]|uniref:dTTP/UTP pyrophosphatase n=1 Tax=Marinisporobacter balticus TaxID=2018667 RepID=A0A4R2LB44_9FIRM|nr:Maf family protein [Marinisporobacter balticus]TCO79988.1 septum formation protein [Marinisporobacter balticus]